MVISPRFEFDAVISLIPVRFGYLLFMMLICSNFPLCRLFDYIFDLFSFNIVLYFSLKSLFRGFFF